MIIIVIIVQIRYNNVCRELTTATIEMRPQWTIRLRRLIRDVQKQRHNNVEIVAALSPCKKIFYGTPATRR